jgi:hypothetical protein
LEYLLDRTASSALSTRDHGEYLAAMEDTTMLDGSQPLFQDLVFTIIPNLLPEERVDQVSERVQIAKVPNSRVM